MSGIQTPVECTNRELFLLISGVKSSLDGLIKANSEEHKVVMDKQDHTNGDVKVLKIWRAYLTGAFSILAIVLGFIAYQTPLIERVVKLVFK